MDDNFRKLMWNAWISETLYWLPNGYNLIKKYEIKKNESFKDGCVRIEKILEKERNKKMARARFNYICITEDNELKKYAAQSLYQIIDETNNEYKSIIREGLHENWDEDYEELTWYN